MKMDVGGLNLMSHQAAVMQMQAMQQQQQQQLHHQQQQQQGGKTSPTLGSAELGADPNQPAKKKTTGPIHNPRYKSILCDHWERSGGTCPYAEKCQFAHGPAELAKWQAHRARQTGPSSSTQQQIPQQQQMIPPQQQQQQQVQQQMGMFTSPTKISSSNTAVYPQQYLLQQQQPQQQQQQQQSFGMYKPVLSTTPMKASIDGTAQSYAVFAPQDVYNAYLSTSSSSMTSPIYASQQQQQQQQISPAQQNGNVFAPTQQYAPISYQGYMAHPTQSIQHQQQQQKIPSQQRSPSPSAAYLANAYGQHTRQTPAGSLSSSPPGSSPFGVLSGTTGGYTSSMMAQSSRRSVSPADDELELRSHHDLMDVAVPRSASDPRRTASLPHLFSRDFLASLNGNELGTTGSIQGGNMGAQQVSSATYHPMGGHHANGGSHPHHNQQSQGGNGGSGGHHSAQSSLVGLDPSMIDTASVASGASVHSYPTHPTAVATSRLHNHSSNTAPSTSPPLMTHYPSYRRGSAPPVVLSVVTNSLGDYNSLADLDSLADELVSEPATSASQLFNMPTVFPGSIKGSINEYL